MKQPPPALSVVLPVLNESRDLSKLLDELLAQTSCRGGFEILVADGGSSDETRDIVMSAAREHPNVRLLDNPRRRSSAGRNVGARASSGRYVLFLDGHCEIPRADYLVRVVDLFESSGADCLCRPQPLDRLVDGSWARAASSARHSWLGHHPGSDIYGGDPGFTDPESAGAAYTRQCFESVGGYDERFDACEDVEFNHRVAKTGFRAYRHPDLAVHYRPRSTPAGLFIQLRRYGRGRARLMARHGIVPWVLVAAALVGLALPAILALLDWRLAALAVGGLSITWLLLASIEGFRLGGLRVESLRVVLCFAAIHAGLVLGFCRGLLELGTYRTPTAIESGGVSLNPRGEPVADAEPR